MSKNDRVADLIATLTNQLTELDALDASIAAAHLDSAINALCQQFGVQRNTSTAD